jgi:gas vesicle protein
MNRDHAIGIGIGLLAGAAIGGTLALLYAPQSGKETRQMIKDKTVSVIDSAKEKTSDVIDMVKEAASEANRKGKAAVQALKN